MATYRFKVKLDATTDPKNPAVTITPQRFEAAPDEISLITFSLDPESTAGAKFPSTPIQWLRFGEPGEPGEPVDLPSWFAMHRHNARYFALWDFNSTPERSDHHFQVSVFYDVDGKLYSTDPVIVNEAPSGGF